LIDRKKADRAVKFIEQLKHTKGTWAGQNFKLLPWQRKIIRDVYGTVKKDGYRQYRTVFIEVPKKNGKSELAAAVGLKQLCADGEFGGEVYCCAVDREQAGLVYSVAEQMVLMNPELNSRCKIISSRKRIVYHPTNSFLQVMSSDVPSKHGINPSAIIFDELHAQENDKLWSVMTFGSMDARKQPLLFIITTAGNDENSICKKEYDYAKKVLTKKVIDPNYYPVIFEADKEADWKDEKVWAKANPSLGHTISIERMREACQKAQEVGSEENWFRQLRLNQWVNQASRWIKMDIWNKAKETFTEEDFHGERCYAGLDLSSVNDITSYALIFLKDRKYYSITRFFIPEEVRIQKELRDKVPYSEWIKSGHVISTPGNTIDYETVEAQFDKDAQLFNIQRIGFDRWNSDYIVQNLMKKGMTCVPVGMGYYNMNAPTKRLETLILNKQFIHNFNPVLSNHMDNMVIQRDPAGNIKPDKAKASQKIDGVVANIISLAVFDDKTEESIYEKRGVLYL
jgi:phage terminase large subunit-like protein